MSSSKDSSRASKRDLMSCSKCFAFFMYCDNLFLRELLGLGVGVEEEDRFVSFGGACLGIGGGGRDFGVILKYFPPFLSTLDGC